MTDLKERLSVLDQSEPPELWRDIAHREPGPTRGRGSKIPVIALALTVFAASATVLVRALDTDRPAASPPPVIRESFVGGRPIRPIAVGFGAAWVIVQDDETGKLGLARIDDASGEVVRVASAEEAGYVTVGAGSVWTATCTDPSVGGCGASRVLRIDPESLESIATIEVVDFVSDITFGADSVWLAAHRDGESLVVRIDPETNAIRSRISGQFCCRALGYGEGRLWGVASQPPHDRELAIIDPETEAVSYPGLHDDRLKYGVSLVVAGEGAAWVETAGPGREGTIGRIDPGTGAVTNVAQDVGLGWFRAAEGAVWIARSPISGPCVELVRLDPVNAAETVAARVRMGQSRSARTFGPGGSIYSVAAGAGAVWLAIDHTWQVVRIDVPSLGQEAAADPGCTLEERIAQVQAERQAEIEAAGREGRPAHTERFDLELWKLRVEQERSQGSTGSDDEVVLDRQGAPITCRSPNRPGLLTCREAVARAGVEGGPAGKARWGEASLEYAPPASGKGRVLAWIIRWHDAPFLSHGPPPGSDEDLIGEWAMVLDARTGEFINEGGSGHPPHEGRPSAP
jgi:hypothetical protein